MTACLRFVDAAVHPLVSHGDQLREFMREPWRSRPLPPAVDRALYRPPFAEYLPDTESRPETLPASDPALLARRIIDEAGAEAVVLLPLTRGMLADTRLEVAIAAATNDWLAAEWLSAAGGRFYGSLRIAPRAPREAVREIERWAGHPGFVQVAVPLEAHAPYGAEQYFPIWEAAARHGLPVAVHADGIGTGVEPPPTPVGYPTHFTEVFAMTPGTAALHLASLITEGVFERLEGLRIVFADGGFDLFGPLIWRLDKDWRASRSDIPWTQRPPSEYLSEHVRFVLDRWSGPPGESRLDELIEIWQAGGLLLYGSNYPSWDQLPAAEAAASLPEHLRERVMAGNARDLYRLNGPGLQAVNP